MKVYFAGPNIFYPDYVDYITTLKQFSAPFDIEPVFSGEFIEKDPHRIAQFNLELIKKSKMVIANLNPFRGNEPDSGTVFECGYAVALGIPV
ncbi:MAG: nucleoside 2-deoxyribosyltransferase, partial [Deltaproteobacteria bacterium]|nr:nucleoside 2-deoxyribosyltransferase [Deltaproteobacteria bacterium]